MNQFFLTLPRNIIDCFKGWNLVWHATAVILTLILAVSGFDWLYFRWTRSLWHWMFPAAIIGQFVPVALPLLLLAAGHLFKNAIATRTAWATGQAAVIGWLISSAYKAVTGRPHPPRLFAQDISHVFHFGFLRGGIFWGWPSSHTATAFAMAVTLWTLFPQRRGLGIAALAYAGYIGLGVSMTIHWFSDFVAGAIIGTIIGRVAGKSFLTNNSTKL